MGRIAMGRTMPKGACYGNIFSPEESRSQPCVRRRGKIDFAPALSCGDLRPTLSEVVAPVFDAAGVG